MSTNRAREAPPDPPFVGAGPKDCQVALEGNGTHLKVSLGHHRRNYNQCHIGDGTLETQEGASGIVEWNQSSYYRGDCWRIGLVKVTG